MRRKDAVDADHDNAISARFFSLKAGYIAQFSPYGRRRQATCGRISRGSFAYSKIADIYDIRAFS
jgi:hypothetical protein